jgi:hypothetical protein
MSDKFNTDRICTEINSSIPKHGGDDDDDDDDDSIYYY